MLYAGDDGGGRGMRTFTLVLQSRLERRRVDGVESFVGEDRSGAFGLLAGHARMIAALELGLARYRTSDGAWTYVALPGGVLYFSGDTLTLSARRFVCGADYTKILEALERRLLVEEEKMREVKESLHHLEEAMLKRLWQAGREVSALP